MTAREFPTCSNEAALSAALAPASAMIQRFDNATSQQSAGRRNDFTEWERHPQNWEVLRAAGYPAADLWKMLKEPNSKWKWDTVAKRWVPMLDAIETYAAFHRLPAHAAPAAWPSASSSSSAVAPAAGWSSHSSSSQCAVVAVGSFPARTLTEYELAILRTPIQPLPWDTLPASAPEAGSWSRGSWKAGSGRRWQ